MTRPLCRSREVRNSQTSMKYICFLWMFFSLCVDAQKKNRTYLSKGQPGVEDNSFLLEEAFNQEAGSVQCISTFVFGYKQIANSYSLEVPLKDVRHQLSCSVEYRIQARPQAQIINDKKNFSGVGDSFLSYRPLLFGKNNNVMVIPRISLVVPTGNSAYGFGYGGWGGQWNLAVTKRISKKLVSNFNGGYTIIANADHYGLLNANTVGRICERNVSILNSGGSIIWLACHHFNCLLEFVSFREKQIDDDGSLSNRFSSMINPGVRKRFNIGSAQIVPGISAPVCIYNRHYAGTNLLLYLSVEY